MPEKIDSLLGQVSGGGNLSFEEMSTSFDAIMLGQWTDDQIALLLTALAAKGETVDEVAGAADAMRRRYYADRLRHAEVLDTCGTGGGDSKMFNVSTTAAIVAAAAGVPVAKHGNRSITSTSGSADVLTELGVNIFASTEQVEACLDELGLCFCFAPVAHPAMKHAAAVRKPTRHSHDLQHPRTTRESRRSLLSVARSRAVAVAAAAGGSPAAAGDWRRSFVVSGEDGIGDVTLAGVTNASEVSSQGVRDFKWQPEDFSNT